MPLVLTGVTSFNIERFESGSGASVTGSFTYEKDNEGPFGTQAFWSNTNDFDAVSDDSDPSISSDLTVGDGIGGSGILTKIPTVDHRYSGSDVVYGTIKSGEEDRYRLLYQGSDGLYTIADKDSYDTRCTHMSTHLLSTTQKLLKQGIVRDETWNWTVGGDLYLGDAGTITQDVSGYTTGDVVQIVGRAISADVISFDPERGAVEVA